MARATRVIRCKGHRIPGRIGAGIIWKDGRCLGGQERRHLRLRCLPSPTILSIGDNVESLGCLACRRECVHGFRGGAVLICRDKQSRAASCTYEPRQERATCPREWPEHIYKTEDWL